MVLQEGRFPNAGWPENGDHVTCNDFDVDVLDQRDIVADGHVVQVRRELPSN